MRVGLLVACFIAGVAHACPALAAAGAGHASLDIALAGGAPPEPVSRELLQRYRAYRQTLAATRLEGATVAGAVQRRYALRRVFFSVEECAELFSRDDRYDAFTAARLALRDRGLPDGQYRSRLQALEASLPDDLRRARHEPLLAVELPEAEAFARRRGADAEGIRRLRVAQLGSAAAQRLFELDVQRANWRQRVERYHRLLSVAPGQAEAWAQQHFSARERLRLGAERSDGSE
ncbi:lipase secretion chaperone [Paludibacterium yongneupense]|uniref:lipase secretion chaperone n=1 Tax=Paludibacterium yongneupense TaxID=400061 RepID=UPI0003F898DE|nr:lipase secretion chaperone [Paludibacterium yongneupense]